MTAGKNSGIEAAGGWRTQALFFSLLLMAVSAFGPRGLLSASCLLFFVLALVHRNFLQQVKAFAAAPYLVLFSLLFLIPFVSGFWSGNLHKWGDVVRIKLPLLFFPLAFAGRWQLSQKRWAAVAAVSLLAVFAGCVWGLADYAQDTQAIHEGYLKAKTIRTPLENDHVRFSWLVSAAVILCLYLMQAVNRRIVKIGVAALAFFFVVYLHVLSARTGILSLYLFLLLYGLWLLGRMRSQRFSLAVLAGLVALPVAAYLFLPTFKARLRYNLYDLSFVRKSEYLPGSSDGARTMSLKAGWQVLQENPLGVGAGDVMQEAEKWYAANVPQALPTDKFYPSSEWLMYGAFAGWPGVLLFTVAMAAPFFVRAPAPKIFWTGLHATAAFSFAFDMGLEVQYGVFLYAFAAMCWWKGGAVNGEWSMVNGSFASSDLL